MHRLRALPRPNVPVAIVVCLVGAMLATMTASRSATAATVTVFPSGTTIETGTLRGGGAAQLSADDNSYFEVNSTTSGTRTSSWYGTFAGVPAAPNALKVSYRGKNSQSCTQTVALWQWASNSWVQLDSRAVGNTEVSILDLDAPGTDSAYVSGGSVRVRVRCTRNANFFASGELMRISFDSIGPAAPTGLATSPVSPANDNAPEVLGTAAAGSTVKVYTNASCTSVVAATGTAAAFASPGLTVSVADNSSTTFYATATDAAGNSSGCSNGSPAYVEDSTAPPAPTGIGSWSQPTALPVVAVHAALLPTGKVVMLDWAGGTPDNDQLYDPVTGKTTSIPWGPDLACAGQVLMADGRLMVVGGTPAYDGLVTTSIFDPVTQKWSQGADMARSRWYPTTTPLGDGRVLVVSGDGITIGNFGQPDPLINPSYTIPEIYNPATNTWTSIPSAHRTIPLYPFMFLLPDGRVFEAGPDKTTRTLDLTTGLWSTVGTSPIDGHSAVMYRPGKILKSGKWADPSDEIPHGNSNNRAAVIDMTKSSPSWREVGGMVHPRSYQTLTVLPDGKVLATGGSTTTEGTLTWNAVMTAEMWDPDTEKWTDLAAMQTPRLYHSTSLLLPDGRVLLSGGGRVGGEDELSAEIYSPPYLSKGPRPVISSAPTTMAHGASYTVATPDASRIGSVSLMHLGAVTHSVDMGQSYVPLNFANVGGSLRVDVPSNPNVVPPGDYMLFIVDTNGVPSVASMVRVPLPGADAVAPTAPTSLTAHGAVGSAALAWTAATDNVGIAMYNVHRGTTAGFAPSSANRVGRVSGTSFTDAGLPAGTYYYKVTAEDAAGNVGPASNEVSATVTTDTSPPTVVITSPTGGTVSGTVAIGADASDDVSVAGVQFKIDGAPLGPEDTTAPYTATWDTRLAANGVHTIQAVARDPSGNQRTASVSVSVANTGTPGLVGRWSFDEGVGAVATDTSGNANHGSISGATWTVNGRYGQALVFNGSNSIVSVADSASLDLTTGMTVEAWVNPSAAMGSSWRSVLMKEQPGGEAWGLYGNVAASRPDVEALVSNGSYAVAQGTSAVPANAWTHLAGTYDGSSVRLYVNGVLTATSPLTGNLLVTANPFSIGGNTAWGENFQGLIDEVRVYNRSLTATEIQADMANATSAQTVSMRPGATATFVAARPGSGTSLESIVGATAYCTLEGISKEPWLAHRGTRRGKQAQN